MVRFDKIIAVAFQITAFIATISIFPFSSAVAQFGVEPTFSTGGEFRIDTGDSPYLESLRSSNTFRVDVDYYEDFCIVKIKGFPDFYGKITNDPDNGVGCEFYPLWNTTMHIDTSGTSLIARDPITRRIFFRFVGGFRAESLDSMEEFELELAASILLY